MFSSAEVSSHKNVRPSLSQDSLLVRTSDLWSHDRKVASLNPSRSSGTIFFSTINFVCWLLLVIWCLFHPMLLQWHVKNKQQNKKNSHSTKSVGGRLHLNDTHTPLTQQSWCGWPCHCPGLMWSYPQYPETSLHTTCQVTFCQLVVSAC